MIALGTQEDFYTKEQEQQEQPEQKEERKHIFQDEVKVDGKTVLNIPFEMAFYEQKRGKRKSRWGEKETKKKVHQNVVFDPLKAIEFPQELLALTNGDEDVSNLFKRVKKGSKWEEEWEKTFNPPPIHLIPRKLELDEFEYVLRLYRLDELNKKLSINDFVTWDPDVRSPSPEPVYDPKSGMRTNTREQRGRDRLLREQADVVDECVRLKPNTFVAPNDFRPLKKEKKIYLPEDDPDVNYIGIIIGPRGSTQKILENKSGCRISIRGRGTKQSKFNSDEQMHVLLQANSDDQIERGADLIDKLLRGEDAEVNEIKQSQQYQLQVIQGLIKEDYCESCHEKGHRTWACPNANLWKKDQIKCSICGDRSHPSIDCPQKESYQQNQNNGLNKVEQEFANFLCELEGGEKAKQLLDIANGTQPQTVKKIKNTFLTENITDILALTNGPSQDWRQYQKEGYSISQALANLNSQEREKLLVEQQMKQQMVVNNVIREEVTKPSSLILESDQNRISSQAIQYHYNPQYLQQAPQLLGLSDSYSSKPQLNITSLTPLSQQQAQIQKMNNLTLPQFEMDDLQKQEQINNINKYQQPYYYEQPK